ncbi:MAG TPA: hypothetical protein VEK76_07710 [Candidatus Binatia bacterium]|nr:hypothetical protein [Candidatus Binatia bacterium]
MSDDGPAVVKAAMARLDHIHRLSGQIVSDVAAIEMATEAAIAPFFASGASIMPLREWVLWRISLSDKVGILEHIADAIGIKAQTTIRRLRRANEIRNDLAHSQVTYNIGATSGESFVEEFHQWQKARASRGGYRMRPVDLTQLEHQAAFTSMLDYEVMRIFAAVLARKEGQDPVARLATMDAANPELAAQMEIPEP